MSTARTLILIVLSAGLTPCRAQAQSVVVTHVVRVEVPPVASVRDSGWARIISDSASLRWTWTGEVRANSTSELLVRGPAGDDSEKHVRVGDGPWVRLHAGAWNAISVLGTGRRHITIDYSAAPSAASQGPPDVRIR